MLYCLPKGYLKSRGRSEILDGPLVLRFAKRHFVIYYIKPMKILSIETSCDETAISILEATETMKSPVFKILSAVVHSQADLHAKWLGVVPNIAKREHAANLVPILNRALEEAGQLKKIETKITDKKIIQKTKKILEKEPGLADKFLDFVPTIKTPQIDAIAVTYGPGLEPALWTGINFAKALSLFWKINILPINHMEGHALSAILPDAALGVKTKTKIQTPAMALLISGGHTEIVLIEDILKYKVIGQTRDDAVGEAFDKVARMLGLPYPGGPHISKLAEKFSGEKKLKLPRPMINSGDLDFSFSGLKTSVLYKIKELGELSEKTKAEFAHEFEESVIEVLTHKIRTALKKHKVKGLLIGGGVVANKKIRTAFQNLISAEFPKIKLFIPHHSLSTDNATMIAIAGYLRWLKNKGKKSRPKNSLKAQGNLILR